jgi:hypothetical protein
MEEIASVLQGALRQTVDDLLLPFEIDREAYQRCMEARGDRLPLRGPGGQGERS